MRPFSLLPTKLDTILNEVIFCIITVDGSLSDTTVDALHRNSRMDPRGSGGAIRQGPNPQGGLGKKSNSTSQLSAAGK